MFDIYVIKNTVNGKIYVGQTSKGYLTRWIDHLNKCRQGRVTRLYSSINRHGRGAFCVNKIAEADSREWANYLEKIWILLLDCRDPEKGYNMTEGGGGGDTSTGMVRNKETIEKMRISRIGYTPSQETRDKIGRAHKGRKLPESAKRKISEFHKGRVVSEETRQKLSEASKGRKHSQEAKNKMSLSRIGKKSSPETIAKLKQRVGEKANVYNHAVSTDEVVAMYGDGMSTRDIAKVFNVDKTCVSGRLKKAGVELRPPRRKGEKCRSS